MSEDSELERLKARRLAEMQRNISSRQDEEPQTPESPRDYLASRLGFRGLEVLETAESQFPKETAVIVGRLCELFRSGEIGETLDGGRLLALFRSVGLGVRMATKINVEKDGKLVSLGERIRSSQDGEQDAL